MQPAQLGTLQPPQQVVVGQPEGITLGRGGVDVLRTEGFSVGLKIFGCGAMLCSGLIIAAVVGVAMSSPHLRFALLGVSVPGVFFLVGLCILLSITATSVHFDRNQQVVTVSKRHWVPCCCATTQNIPFSDLGAMTCTQHRPLTHTVPQTVTLHLAYQGMQGAGLTLLCRPVSGAEATLQLEWATYLATLCPGPAGMLPATGAADAFAGCWAQPMLLQPTMLLQSMMTQPEQPVAMQQGQACQQGEQQLFAQPQMYAPPPAQPQSYGEHPYGVL
jgi:hypothetical protein